MNDDNVIDPPMDEAVDVRTGAIEAIEPVKDDPENNHEKQFVDNGIQLTPLETAILHMLHFSGNDMNSDKITENMQKVFRNVKPADVTHALNDALMREHGYVDELSDVDGLDGDRTTRYIVSDKATRMYFSYAVTDRRKCNHVGLEVMLRIADQMMRKGLCCKLHLGDQGIDVPDMRVYGPKTVMKGKATLLMHDRWNDDAGLIIRLVDDPTDYIAQIHTDLKSGTGTNSDMWFVVYSKAHEEDLRKKLNEKHVHPSSYIIITVTDDDIADTMVGQLINIVTSYHMRGRWLPMCRPIGQNWLKGGPRVPNLKTYRGITNIFGMTELEHEIYCGINDGLSTIPHKVRRRIGSAASNTDIRYAVDRLYQHGYIFLYYLHHRVVMEPFDDGIPSNLFFREKTMGRVGAKAQSNTMAGWNVPSDLPEQKSNATFRQKVLEHDIYEVINNGLSIKPYVIRTMLRRYESANNIRMAVNGLLKKRRIIMVYQNKKNKRVSTKSNVPKNKYYRETIMCKTVLEEDPKPTALAQTAPGANPTAVVAERDVPAKAEPEIADAELAGVAATAQDAGQDSDLGTREIQHMSDLEHDIYHAINEGLSIEPDLIRMRLGKKEYVSDSSIRKAVSNLCKKKYVIIDYQTKLNKMDSLRGKGPKKTYYRKAIIRKAVLEEDPDPQIGRAKVTPTGKVDDTTMTKMAVYTDNEIEDMGPKRLMGLLKADRTTKIQKDKIMEILKKKGRGIGNDPPVFE